MGGESLMVWAPFSLYEKKDVDILRRKQNVKFYFDVLNTHLYQKL